jgi:hypothetical protein
MGFYINDAGEGGLRQWLHFGKAAPFPCTPTPRRTGQGRPQTRKNRLLGYILILQDDYLKVTFLNCLTGIEADLFLRPEFQPEAAAKPEDLIYKFGGRDHMLAKSLRPFCIF